MSKLSFTKLEMMEALHDAGYLVKEETEEVYDSFTESEVPYKVWNVYLDGVKQCEWGGTGLYRVEYIFNQELERRLLKLFASL